MPKRLVAEVLRCAQFDLLDELFTFRESEGLGEISLKARRVARWMGADSVHHHDLQTWGIRRRADDGRAGKLEAAQSFRNSLEGRACHVTGAWRLFLILGGQTAGHAFGNAGTALHGGDDHGHQQDATGTEQPPPVIHFSCSFAYFPAPDFNSHPRHAPASRQSPCSEPDPPSRPTPWAHG